MSAAPWDYIAKLVCIGDSGCGKSSLTIRLCEGRFVPHHDVTIGVEFGSRIVPVGPPYSNTLPSPTTTSSQPSSPADADADTDTDGTPTASKSGSAAAAAATGLPPPPTIPIEKPNTPQPPQKHMKLSLWDTAGQETYKSVTRSYFRGASGALLVFDLTRKSTFQHVTDWLNDLRQIAEPDIVVVLVGNKADLASPDAPEEDDDDTHTHTHTPGTGPYEAGDGKTKGGNKREVTRAEAEAWAARNGVLEYVETSAKSGANVEMAFMRVAERIFQNIQAGRYDLNDRRSGVKGPSAGGAGGAAAAAASKSVRLTGGDAGRGLGGGCC
ncbi:P-loop containing nucleoside triphosphate hydrolase protein [Parachaetomium inaequale]|uniref:P-loop containing nucleoside triphosphate hydrolase protein n=1 Tax=Parachaetomium inaequale TaxID=2588326 RepID=A0AAN6SQ43_9PEZI|nr:P-loop containing nucleoside triphosphate hydrolase protein [Parachaetomium inaequale]